VKIFGLEDVSQMLGFEAVTQQEEETVDLLINKCNELRGKMQGFIETRRTVLNERFDRRSCREVVEICVEYDGSNQVVNKILRVQFERFCRDFVRENMVETFVGVIRLRLRLLGSVEAVVDAIEHYFTSGKICPMAQTLREAMEEIEKGKIIYNEPNPKKSI
jgi:hypothetical protein